MRLVDQLMQRWANAERRRELCSLCRDEERDPSTSEGRYCSPTCQEADGQAQAFGW